jgi:hypothetical protein
MCDRNLGFGEGHYHHIKYKAQGRDDNPGNIILLCYRCHVPRAHQHTWIHERLPKRVFMGLCYSAIGSDYDQSCIDEYDGCRFAQWLGKQEPLYGDGETFVLAIGLEPWQKLPIGSSLKKDIESSGWLCILSDKLGYDKQVDLFDPAGAYYRVFCRETGRTVPRW